MYAVLAGGVGGSRFVSGLVQVVPPEQVTVIVNTGDDVEMYGLHVSPDIDINLYMLAGLLDPERKWGWRGDSFVTQQVLREHYGHEPWFNLGDRDLASHLFRTMHLRQGMTLSEVTDLMRRRLGVRVRVLPMSDEPVATYLLTAVGTMHFQEYLIRHRMEPRITGLELRGIAAARPAPGVLEALTEATVVFIPPSNPIVSVGPILALPGVRAALAGRPVVGVSPIIGGQTVKGPADRMLRDLGSEATAAGVAACYSGLMNAYVIDQVDAAVVPALAATGLRVHAMDTLMSTPEAAAAVARAALALVR